MIKKIKFNTCTEELLIIADGSDGDDCCCSCNDGGEDELPLLLQTTGNDAFEDGMLIKIENKVSTLCRN